jgi:hypothetical protein
MLLVLQFEREGHRFEVFDQGIGAHGRYAGHCDGAPSLVADRPDVAARTLIRKHVKRVPQHLLAKFQPPRERGGNASYFI